MLKSVATLVDQNLLKSMEKNSGEARFGMLETIREYGLEQLAASHEVEVLRHQHANFFLALAEKIAPVLIGANQSVGLAQLRMELDNLRAALAWSQGETNGREIALRLEIALGNFWLLSGYWSEGRRWSEVSLTLIKATDRTLVRAFVLENVGCLAAEQNDHPAARAWLEEGLELARELDAGQRICGFLIGLSLMANAQHDYALARGLSVHLAAGRQRW